MPVRLKSNPDPAELAITASYLQVGMDNFREHYFLDSGSSDFIADFMVKWDDIYNAVQSYLGNYPEVTEDQIAMRFIHTYDPSTFTLYLRLQLCQMTITTITDFDRPVRQLMDNTYESWYDLSTDTVMPANPGALSDDVYLNSFIYRPLTAGDVSEPLSEDGGLKFVRTVTFPWYEEVYEMYKENIENIPDPNAQTMYIHFASCSYTGYNPGDDAVMWPHGLVMYLQFGNKVLLNDDEDAISIFRCKGCDMGTSCPPKCGSYIEAPLSVQAPRA